MESRMEREDEIQEAAAPGGLNGSEVAVIGMAGRFPGADTVERFWENLANGVESIRFLTDEELLAAGVGPDRLADPTYVKAAAMIDGIELFDAALFGIPPHEAQLIDPQQRLFLECAWEALERAGYNREAHDGLVGVYAGTEMNGYLFNLYSNPEVLRAAGSFQLEVANDKDYLATRVSYKLNLRGPSFTVQSACSTSLVAVHLACQALLSGDCDLALAGGVSLQVPQRSGYLAHEGGIKSPDGHCRAFDARAQGTVFGSGMGLVVLKRLGDALADGDLVRAVIKGTAVNNDGALKIGYSAPGAEGQFQVVRAAHQVAEVDPATITYVEAHGTGTALGDPIEVAALTRAFRAATDRRGFCALGSVKTNVGHLRAAAGAAGLIKTVLAMEHRQLPPTLHLERPHPQIDFADSPFYLADRRAEWRRAGTPLRAGVSAFGVGGTNAHVVLEEAPPLPPSGPARPHQLLVLSAHTPTALATLAGNLAEHLRRHPGLALADAAWTLQVGRRTGRHRGMLVAADSAAAAAALATPGRLTTAFQERRDRPVVFLFPGQGAQHPGMGRELYAAEPAFRAGVDRCCEILRPLLGLDLRDVLYPPPERAAEAALRLEQTALAQPALFAIEHSLATLWMAWGIHPRAMLGHSVGEYVAACLAGVFTLADALALVAERGRLMQELPPGAMLAVPLPESELLPLLEPRLAVAAVNAPARTVVSGEEEAIAALAERLAGRGVACRRLHTSHAFHSAMMEPILAPFTARVARVRREAPQLPFLSNATGTWITAAEAVDPAYWARHLRGTVRFADGLRALAEEPEAILLEVGPGQALAALSRQVPGRPPGQAVVRSLPHAREERADDEFLLAALGRLWLAGAAVDWRGFHAGERRRRVELPSYPFERQRYWVDFRPATLAGPQPEARKELADWFQVPVWKPSVAPLEAAAEPQRWLLLADGGGLAATMARRLAERGDAVALAFPGAGFAATAPGRFALAPGDPAGYAALLDRLREEGGPPQRVVHLWGVGEPAGADCETLCFFSTLWLGQALGRLDSPVELRVVTDGLAALPGEPVLAPGKATALGPVRVLPLEHPEIGCAAIDVVVPAAPAGRERLADRLIAEALAPAAEPVVALRGEDRWSEGFAPLSLPAAGRLPVAERGVYLITGGLGGIGLTLARELARSARARLVLTGRSALPARPDWDSWLALHGEAETQSRRIRAVQELEELGAEVLALAADVADEGAMRSAVAQARQRFGPIQGAIHAAGLPGAGVVQLKTAAAAARVLAPKVQGTRALAAALAGEPLDFLVLCSSTYALTGGVGQVDYCAANAFLDAFARYHAAAAGVRTLALDWGPWQEVGMAAAAAGGTARGGLPARPAPAAATDAPLHPLLDRRLAPDEGTGYATALSPERHWILAEHRILGTPAVPVVSYLEMARAAFTRDTGAARVEIRDVSFTNPLLVAEGDEREVRTLLAPAETGADFHIVSRGGAGGEWQEHARGRLLPIAAAAPVPDRRDLAALAARCGGREVVRRADGTAAATPGLVSWGPRWQGFQHVRLGEDEALLTLELPPAFDADLDGLGLHPALLDLATSFGGSLVGGGTFLPWSYGSLRYLSPLPGRLHAHIRSARGKAPGGDAITLDVTLVDDDGTVRVEVADFTMRQVTTAAGRARPAAAGDGAPAAAVAAAAPPRGMATWIRPEEGVEAFRRVLSRCQFPQVAIAPMGLAAAAGRQAEGGREPAAARFPRPGLETAYAAPTTDAEAALAEIWQVVLGIDRVGIHDNFFDLGGDSVIAIQVIAHAARQGFHLLPDQLFQHQTIAALARLQEPALPAAAGGADAAGEPAVPAAIDFPEADLSPESLDRLLSRLKDPQP
jgi:acyl transferase domain-containing protein